MASYQTSSQKAKALNLMFPSRHNLFLVAVLVAIVGCFAAVSELDGVFLSTKLAFAPYILATVPAIFLYLYVSNQLLEKLNKFFSWRFFFTLLWWVVGCLIGYWMALFGEAKLPINRNL